MNDSDTGEDVIVTGMGLVTPVGATLQSTWQSLLAGKSGIGPITTFDPRGLGVRIAGGVEQHEYASTLLGRATRSRREGFALRAIEEALRNADLDTEGLNACPLGLFSGCERESYDDYDIFADYERKGHDDPEVAHRHRLRLYERQPDSVAKSVRDRLPTTRLFFNYTMACAAGAVAVAQALRWLRRGVVDRALVFAADTPINLAAVHGFEELGALSTQNDAPEKACRPFDRERDGFVLAEGAGAVVLETESLARARGHRGIGRLLGAGITNNQAHITKTPPAGEHAARAMRAALADAKLEPSQVGYINAHGTSTDVGDSGEVAAIRAVFDTPPPVSSTKSMTGHMVAASGLVELIISQLAVSDGRLPPTINLDEQDPDCALDCIPNLARSVPISYALSNSFGFGGTNVSLTIGRAP